MDVSSVRSLFPQLQESVYGKPLVYLDNAATSLRPLSVVREWDEMSLKHNSNLHRAVHKTAVDATERYEAARAAVASFIGSASPKEIVFTSGTTQSINLVAACLENAGFFSEGDEILIAESEHHSDIVPWQLVSGRKSLKIKILPVKQKGEIEIDKLPALLTSKTKICCVAQVSNVLGVINPIKEICEICHANGTLVLVDGAQGIAHLTTDVRELGCDFYAFSGHKMFAAPGVGVLYGRQPLLESLPPYMGGGEMIESVSWEKTTFAPVPGRFEAGTQNISGVPTLVPAIELCKRLKTSEIEKEQAAIKNYILDAFAEDADITLYGNPAEREKKIPLFSISVKGAHHEDLALILDKMGIATRSGQMCAEPLMDRFGVTGMLRASFVPYNTLDEAKYFVECLKKAIKMLK
ncbi:MAG: SufS family cysteine desulfurase [Bacteroidales bacterium]|nr:SufS family cysteine desulfurase [Bacteroidales bacterium]